MLFWLLGAVWWTSNIVSCHRHICGPDGEFFLIVLERLFGFDRLAASQALLLGFSACLTVFTRSLTSSLAISPVIRFPLEHAAPLSPAISAPKS